MATGVVLAIALFPLIIFGPASAAPPPGAVGEALAEDGANSTRAAALVDGVESADPGDVWANSGNPWSNDSYPMSAVIDLQELHDIEALHIYAGQIPFPSDAELDIELSVDGVVYTDAATVSAPSYDAWSDPIPVDTLARYVRLRFGSVETRFDVSEVAVVGSPDDGGTGGGNGGGGSGGGTGSTGELDTLTALDGDNSSNALRLTDGATGPNAAQAWTNPNPWNADNFPMTAIIDLGGEHEITGLHYFVGNIFQPTDNRVDWEYSNATTGSFSPLYTGTNHAWSAWREVEFDAVSARRLRVTFTSQPTMFNLAEIKVFAGSGDGGGSGGGGGTGGGGGGGTGGGNPELSDLPDPYADGALQSAIPAMGERANAFGHDIASHLSDDCRQLHDRYWTEGDDGKAYRTWHPAITYVPETASDDNPIICDFGHEHGYMPSKAGADVFELAGGWPAFGYAAEQAGLTHFESHEGYKSTVAQFRAAVGNAANKGSTLYDAGFDCTWLSLIHQGSFSLDALANNVHEYKLSLSCGDGTELSVNFLYTFGDPDLYNAVGCGGHIVTASDTAESLAAFYGLTLAELASANPNFATADYSTINVPSPGTEVAILRKSNFTRGFDGSPIEQANRPGPGPNEVANGREFVCSPGVVWNELANLQDVTLWTQPNWIERAGSGVLMIQPYYSVIDMPWLVTGVSPDPTGQWPYIVDVERTLDLCYNNNVRIYPDGTGTKFCELGPYEKPTDDWASAESPFNGTRRGVNFKTAWLKNLGGTTSWCTDPWGRSTALKSPPCADGEVEQFAAAIDNHWNDGTICQNGVCNITGSVRASDPYGNTFGGVSNGAGGYIAPGPAKEFVIDNSQPDDNFDGQPDGARIRGRN